MTKARKTVLMAAAIILLVVFLIFLKGQNKIVYGVSEGTYAALPENGCSPRISLDLQDYRFVLDGDPALSYLNTGTFALDGRLVATTDDGKYTYIFEVVDNDTLRFVQKGSSEIFCHLGGDPIADGTEFKFCEE